MGWKSLPLFIAAVSAQGFTGGNQSNCNSTESFTYAGCFSDTNNGPHAALTWQLSTDSDSVFYYPGYTGSITPNFCQSACRGHGFKYAGLYNQTDCFCSSALPNPMAESSTSNGMGGYIGQNPGTTSDPSVCHIPGQGCSGDSTQFCGSSSGTDIYYDPTVGNSTADRQASNFGYLGCFRNLAPGPLYVTLATTSTPDCAAYCGLLGYAYSGRSGTDNTGNSGPANCGCGSEIQTGNEVSDSFSNIPCSGGSGAVYAPKALFSIITAKR